MDSDSDVVTIDRDASSENAVGDLNYVIDRITNARNAKQDVITSEQLRFEDVKHEEDFTPEGSFTFVDKYIILDADTYEPVNPAECLRKGRTNKDYTPTLLLVAKSSFYSTRDDPKQITLSDYEFERHAKEEILLCVVVGDGFLQWDIQQDHFATGLTSFDSNGNERYYYLTGQPEKGYKSIFDSLYDCIEWAVKIFKGLEALCEDEIDPEQFELITNGFDSKCKELTEYLIDQAFCLRSALPFDPLLPPYLSNSDKDDALSQALNFVADLIRQTGYRVDELIDIETSAPKAKRRRTEKGQTLPVAVYMTKLIDYLMKKKYPQLIGKGEKLAGGTKTKQKKTKPAEVISCSQTSRFNSCGGEFVWHLVMRTAEGSQFSLAAGTFVRLLDGSVLRVVSLWSREEGGGYFVHGMKFVPISETALGVGCQCELVFTNECLDTSLDEVQNSVQVKYMDPPSHQDFVDKPSAKISQELEKENNCDSYFVKQMYLDATQPRFEFSQLAQSAVNSSRSNGDFTIECIVCNNKQASELHVVKSASDEYNLVLKDTVYRKGDTVFLRADTVKLSDQKTKRFEVDMERLNDRLATYRKDPDLYPEFDRWFAQYKDTIKDMFVSNPTYQVALIEQIELDQKQSPVVVLRMFYRPEDTAMTNDEVELSCSRELFLSVRPAHRLRLDKKDASKIVGHCYVKSSEDMEWLKAGPNRFYSTQKLLRRDSVDFETLSESERQLLECNVAKAVDFARTEPLVTMDLFAGVGGLSLGLEQANIADVKWAVELNSSHAHTCELNAKMRGKQVTVFDEDVNIILDDVANDKKRLDGKTYPKKGEIDLICGGPPCQGFSNLNSSKQKPAAKEKRALVISYMSAIDLWRPRFLLFENVGGIQNKVGGDEVLAIMLELLRAMGYQLTVCYVQAAEYGVPQDRKRVFILGAAPGERLPEWPLPSTACWGSRLQRMDLRITNARFNPPNLCPGDSGAGAPYRPVTIFDAMSDLDVKSAKVDDKGNCILPEARSYYQKLMRNGNTVTDHIHRSQTPLLQRRVDLVPRDIPRADWRFLPHEEQQLSNGKRTQLLNYNGPALVMGEWKENRALCPHMIQGNKRQKEICKAALKDQENTLIPSCLPHTSETKQQWNGLFGRVCPRDIMDTIVTTSDLMGKQGRLIHWSKNRSLTARELARGQGFPDSFRFYYNGDSRRISILNQQIGNAVPPPLAKAIGHQIALAVKQNQRI